MRITLDDMALTRRDRAAKCARGELIPHGVEAELNDGRRPGAA